MHFLNEGHLLKDIVFMQTQIKVLKRFLGFIVAKVFRVSYVFFP